MCQFGEIWQKSVHFGVKTNILRRPWRKSRILGLISDIQHIKWLSEAESEVLTENCYKTCILRHGSRFWLEMRQMNVFVHFFRH